MAEPFLLVPHARQRNLSSSSFFFFACNSDCYSKKKKIHYFFFLKEMFDLHFFWPFTACKSITVSFEMLGRFLDMWKSGIFERKFFRKILYTKTIIFFTSLKLWHHRTVKSVKVSIPQLFLNYTCTGWAIVNIHF